MNKTKLLTGIGVWTIYMIPDLAVTLISFLLAIVLPLTALSSESLPKWLSWFQTPDNGLDGDEGFRQTHPRSYWSRVLWLWRNPAYGFSYSVVSANIKAGESIYRVGDAKTNNEPYHPGWLFRQSGTIWEFWYVSRYRGIGGRCFRARLGWKIGNVSANLERGRVPLVASIRFPKVAGEQ